MSIVKQPSAKKSNTNIILDYLEKFPNSPSRTIAKKIYTENIAFFDNFEIVYGRVRYYRGQCGDKDRNKLKNTKFQNYFIEEGGTNLLSPLLPITYKFKILGCSGIRRWDSFRILGIPERYATRGIWQITEVEHGLSGMQWVTEVTGTYRQLQ